MGCQGRLLSYGGESSSRRKSSCKGPAEKKLENVWKSTRPEWMKGRDRRKGWETTLTRSEGPDHEGSFWVKTKGLWFLPSARRRHKIMLNRRET